ncbi:heat shock protein 23-like [Chironomus tepperi]|uniref:heat shock protein 23-like n=1 Tax=Chironomus tepperi TaxID=113505 RepID=UPI00391EFA72
MSMCPFGFSAFEMDGLEPRFGLGLAPSDFFSDRLVPRSGMHHLMTGYKRPWSLRQTAKDMVKDQKNLHFGKDGFQASVDVHHFQPSEITVKTIDNQIIVEGRHEERDDGHGSIQRHFVRKYMLPKEYDMNSVHSQLSSDGVLTIKAPPPPALSGSSEKHVPITHTNTPAHLNIKDHAKSPQCPHDNNGKSPAVSKS